MNIQDAAKRLGVPVSKVSELMAQYELTERDLNDAVVGDLAQDLKGGTLTPQSATPTKAPQSAPGGLAKASAPAQSAGLAKAKTGNSAAQVKQEQEAVAFDMFATPVRSTTYVMERGLEIARETMAQLDEQDAQEVAKDILEARKKSVGELRASSAAWSGRVTAASMATFNMDDFGATIDVQTSA